MRALHNVCARAVRVLCAGCCRVLCEAITGAVQVLCEAITGQCVDQVRAFAAPCTPVTRPWVVKQVFFCVRELSCHAQCVTPMQLLMQTHPFYPCRHSGATVSPQHLSAAQHWRLASAASVALQTSHMLPMHLCRPKCSLHVGPKMGLTFSC